MKGLLISAPGSNQGKTIVTAGLLALLRQELGDEQVVGAKAGPDYIDTAYLGARSNLGLSLDPWGMRPGTIFALLAEQPASMLLVEGTMGLFDGSADRGKGSSADLAILLGLPVVLVVDVSGMSQSIAAVVSGFVQHNPDVNVAGMILNRVGSPRHESLLRAALASIDVAILGVVPRSAALAIESRHLGLIQAGEQISAYKAQQRWADALRPHLNLKAIIELFSVLRRDDRQQAGFSLAKDRRLAIASDAAFRFCYGHWWHEDSLPFSPLANEPIPGDAEAVFLPGGYPELHLDVLARSDRFWRSLKNAAHSGVPISGECGGYMVLGEGIQDEGGRWHQGAELLPFRSSFQARQRHLGYRRLRALTDTPFFAAGSVFRAHEFHYCSIVQQQNTNLFSAGDAAGSILSAQGHLRGSVFGSFMHLIDQDQLNMV